MVTNSYDVNKDRWPNNVEAPWSARNSKAVTLSDSKDLTDSTLDNMPYYAKALYIGSAGDVTVVMASSKDDSVTVKFTGVPVGSILPIMVRRVLSTGTTASAIVALMD